MRRISRLNAETSTRQLGAAGLNAQPEARQVISYSTDDESPHCAWLTLLAVWPPFNSLESHSDTAGHYHQTAIVQGIVQALLTLSPCPERRFRPGQ